MLLKRLLCCVLSRIEWRDRGSLYSAAKIFPAVVGLILLCQMPAFAQAITPPDAAILNMAMETPLLVTSPGPGYSNEQLDYAMTIGIERTPKGRIWACWVAGGDSDKGLFVLSTSDDNGDSWSAPRLVIDPTDAPTGLRRRTLVGALWTDPLGRLWLFFDYSMGYFDGRAGDWATVCENPDDAQPVWSEPRRIWHGATLNKPTVLRSGEWMLPISLWQRKVINPKELRNLYPELDADRKAHVFVSTDQGASWHHRGGIVFPDFSFDEHSIIERRDGSLWMLARTGKGMYESVSRDSGKTWSEPTFAYPHTVSRFFIRRLASGALLLVRHGAIDVKLPKRTHLTAMVSDDDGKTWTGGLLLDGRDGVSYPDGFQAPDGSIFISYDRERAREREVLMARFTEEEVRAGKITSPDSKLQILVHKALGNLKPVPTK